MASMTVLVIFVQLMLGAILRHTGTVEGSKGAALVTSALLAHLFWALVVGGFVVATAFAVLGRTPAESSNRLGYLMFFYLVFNCYWDWEPIGPESFVFSKHNLF